jgi:hypothetical protein
LKKISTFFFAFLFCINLQADVVTDWSKIAFKVVTQEASPNQTRPSHYLAIVNTAMFDAAVAVDRQYQPYAVDIRSLPGASMEAAIVSAAYHTLIQLFPSSSDTLNASFETSLATLPHSQSKIDGIAIGKEVSEKFLKIPNVNTDQIQDNYTVRKDIPNYQLTPPLFREPIDPEYGNMLPFMIKNMDQFKLPGPPDIHSFQFAKELNEVKEIGGKDSKTRSPAQLEVARLWSLHSNVDYDILEQLSKSKKMSLIEKARLYALLNLTLADAIIACWKYKYQYNFWRPVTAIRQANTIGNKELSSQSNWESVLITPSFPEYPAGHTSATGATQAILTAFFGNQVQFELTNPITKVVHRYQSLSEAAEECVNARIYGGMHFRSGSHDGLILGQKIGEYALKNFLQKIER